MKKKVSIRDSTKARNKDSEEPMKMLRSVANVWSDGSLWSIIRSGISLVQLYTITHVG